MTLVFIAYLWAGKAMPALLNNSLDTIIEQARSHGAEIAAEIERQSETSEAMELGPALKRRFAQFLSTRHRAEGEAALPTTAGNGFCSFLRMMAQIGALALGAFLAVRGELSAGGMIGASIIMSRTIGIAEGSLSVLPTIRRVKEAYGELTCLTIDDPARMTAVGRLDGRLRGEGLIVPRGHGEAPCLNRVSFALEPGECLAIVGRAGSGKTTLLHALCGIHSAPIGAVFLGEGEIKTIDQATRNAVIGY